jgi:GT2 family glycosyltransferase
MTVIQQVCQDMHQHGIETRVVPCPWMGVASSRNFAARHASGDLFCFLDNDAAFTSPDCLSRAAGFFAANARLALVSFRVLKENTNEIDPRTWVFRRPALVWSDREFKTFTFTGGAFCTRASSYWEVGGFWAHLVYGREEEDLGLALVDMGYELLYVPGITIRHFPEANGRMSLAERRFVELRNGILVLWRRVPIPLAILAIAGRICTMALTCRHEKDSVWHLVRAVPQAAADWHRYHLRRIPITFKSVWRYAALHLADKGG